MRKSSCMGLVITIAIMTSTAAWASVAADPIEQGKKLAETIQKELDVRPTEDSATIKEMLVSSIKKSYYRSASDIVINFDTLSCVAKKSLHDTDKTVGTCVAEGTVKYRHNGEEVQSALLTFSIQASDEEDMTFVQYAATILSDSSLQ